jgi:periplasmic divalent cation tolerance protein
MSEAPIIVLTTLPDPASAERLARGLVERKLAACVNIQARMTSIYTWKDEIQRDSEHQLVIKTRSKHYPRVEDFIRRQHPYELPEILALPVSDGLNEYIEWVDSCTRD